MCSNLLGYFPESDIMGAVIHWIYEFCSITIFAGLEYQSVISYTSSNECCSDHADTFEFGTHIQSTFLLSIG